MAREAVRLTALILGALVAVSAQEVSPTTATILSNLNPVKIGSRLHHILKERRDRINALRPWLDLSIRRAFSTRPDQHGPY